jgi:tetratricopeptide (TPR) repeat protein
MSNYVYGTSLRYENYLQAKSFEDSLRSEISASSRAIIASNEELASEHVHVLKSMASTMESGFEQLSFDMHALSAGIAELNSTFHWGFSQVLTALGGINDSLRELIRIAKTPAQTWAYEQFEIARDAFRQGLYEDAIQYLNRSINGYGDHTGYNLEYRFHYLLGTIYVGSFKSGEIVDLEKAEEAFMNAAKYARHDHRQEAARCYLGAGWAAYCQGNMRAAETHTLEAISLNRLLPEAHFQIAKIQMHNGHPNTALIPLRDAIQLDRGYTVKACTDGDFIRYQSQVDALLEALRQEAKELSQRSFDEIESSIARLEKLRAEQFFYADELSIATARSALDSARALANSGTYYGYLNALKLCDSARSEVKAADGIIRRKHQQRLNEIEADKRQREETELWTRRKLAEKARGRANTALWTSLAGIVCLPLSPVGLVLGVMALSELKKAKEEQGTGKAMAAILIGVSWIVIFVMAFIQDFLLKGS